jgi:hypothetical protein
MGYERLPVGLSDVRREEKVVEPVMERGRVVILEVEVKAFIARIETRAVDMVAVRLWWCYRSPSEVWRWKVQ